MNEAKVHPAITGEMGEYFQEIAKTALNASGGLPKEFDYRVIDMAVRAEQNELASVGFLARVVTRRLAETRQI